MSKSPQLWVWNGNSETDELDVLRYVKATDKDILNQKVVTSEIARIAKFNQRVMNNKCFRIPLERDASKELQVLADLVSRRAVELLDSKGKVDVLMTCDEIVIRVRSESMREDELS